MRGSSVRMMMMMMMMMMLINPEDLTTVDLGTQSVGFEPTST